MSPSAVVPMGEDIVFANTVKCAALRTGEPGDLAHLVPSTVHKQRSDEVGPSRKKRTATQSLPVTEAYPPFEQGNRVISPTWSPVPFTNNGLLSWVLLARKGQQPNLSKSSLVTCPPRKWPLISPSSREHIAMLVYRYLSAR